MTTVACTGEILTETEKALKFFDYYTEEEHWIPLSQIETITRHDASNYATIHVAAWFAKKKGMIRGQ